MTEQRWPEGINPYLDHDKRKSIVDARRARAKELEAWRKGAGKKYLRSIGGGG